MKAFHNDAKLKNIKLKSVREVVDSLEPIFTEADAHSTEKGYAPIVPSKQLAENTITQDRQHTKEVLMGRVREKKGTYPEYREKGSDELVKAERLRAQGFDSAIDQALKIIEDIMQNHD